MENAKAQAAHDKKGRFGIIRSRAMPMAMAANILCKEIVHKAFQASFFVSATPIAMPSKTEWKHEATIKKMLSPTKPARATKWCTC